MESSDVIKTIIPSFCPHCHQEIFVKVHALPPSLSSILNQEAIAKAKEEALRGISTLGLSKSVLTRAEAEIKSEDIIFGPEDVPGIIEQYKTNGNSQ